MAIGIAILNTQIDMAKDESSIPWDLDIEKKYYVLVETSRVVHGDLPLFDAQQ